MTTFSPHTPGRYNNNCYTMSHGSRHLFYCSFDADFTPPATLRDYHDTPPLIADYAVDAIACAGQRDISFRYFRLSPFVMPSPFDFILPLRHATITPLQHASPPYDYIYAIELCSMLPLMMAFMAPP